MNLSLRELDHRSTNGIDVTLLWNPLTDGLVVRVVDEGLADEFELECAAHEALSVFNHPFAYAATRPVRRRPRVLA